MPFFLTYVSMFMHATRSRALSDGIFIFLKARFSPRRNRDVSSKLNQVGGVFGAKFMSTQGTHEAAFNNSSHPIDSHSDIYDSRITVSLSSVRIIY